MKVIVKFIVIIFSLFLMFSCGSNIDSENGNNTEPEKISFENLPETEKQEIVDYSIEIISPQYQKILDIAFDFSISDEESEEEMNKIRRESEKIFNETVQERYPNVDFWKYIDFENYISEEILKSIPNVPPELINDETEDNETEEIKKEEINTQE